MFSVAPGMSRGWLEAMRRDGLLIGVGDDHYLASDAINWPSARLLVLAAALPVGASAALGTAVWAGGGPTPKYAVGQPITLHAVVRPHTWQRTVGPSIRLRRTMLRAQDRVSLGPISITSPTRTLVDLALVGTADDAPALRWLLTRPGVTSRSARTALAGRGAVRHLRRAEQVLSLIDDGHPDPLAAVAAQPVTD